MKRSDPITGVSCCNISSPEEAPEVKYIKYSRGHMWEGTVSTNEFVFIFKGECRISFDYVIDKIVGEKTLLLLPQGSRFKARTATGVSLVIINPGRSIRFCKSINIDILKKHKLQNYKRSPFLEIVFPIDHYLFGLVGAIKAGMSSNDYMEIKVQELFLLLQAYYPEKELIGFLQPLLDGNSIFAKFVWENYRKVKTVSELADLYSCSVSHFDKKFRKVFGCPAYQWMMKKKTELLFHEIITTDKPFNQIAKEHGFLSNSQFTDYCKKHLGKGPAKIRKDLSHQ